jgi:hypothetical protein
MDIFAETMQHFNLEPYQYTKEEEEELKRDVEFEKILEAKDIKQEQEKENGKQLF